MIVIYHGHAGGTTEKNEVLAYCEQLDQEKYQVLQYQFINQINKPPFVIAIEKTYSNLSHTLTP
ncbi:SAM-dependent methyltransferase [Gracilibacillus boraciitolerans JCM 21714]|uniref:SAM-dependent methyltransferase n=1 Tax=Gracilibacillus boraciitolerans JCM 21714 TaxID=1298598 RepID=W4VMI7_9BACI|nr:SAM-dependent methyltransferase [Gracilibacillus boraciitolerans JCM 21714]